MIYIIIIDYIVFGKVLPISGFIGGACILFGVFKQFSEDK
jgi:drug/metabolite transporter (DMT)-like permease